MNAKRQGVAILGVLMATMLVGCGGGGGGGSGTGAVSPSPAISFPLLEGYKALIVNGLAMDFTVSGSCNGSGRRTFAPATTQASFDGIDGYSAAGSLTMTLSDCTPATVSENYTNYYDSHYVAIGGTSGSGEYGVYPTLPAVPVSVTVGDTGSFGSENYYTDSTKTTPSGSVVETFVVEADTPDTAILNVISKDYNAAGTLGQTAQSRYRMSRTGTLTLISTDIQAPGSAGVHLLLTYR